MAWALLRGAYETTSRYMTLLDPIASKYQYRVLLAGPRPYLQPYS
eukprot:SAG31_NODE_25632_length_457_cov_1.488827_1_plen_45_part_00